MDPMSASAMETSISGGILGVLFALGSCFWRHKRAGKLHGVLLPEGKSSLTAQLSAGASSAKSRVIFCDVESVGKENLSDAERTKVDELEANGEDSRSLVWPKMKQHVYSLRKDFPKYDILVLSGNRELLKFLGCKKIVSYIPSSSLFEDYVSGLSDDAKVQAKRQERTQLLLDAGKIRPHTFTSWDDLQKDVGERFGLSPRL
jgi:hypothetical protein